ncbi:hypothetical protein CTH30272_01987 [Allocatenococcus thiocycli]|nr:hypothetical protein CTH30272_01987 [Catenococcus thiocycli]
MNLIKKLNRFVFSFDVAKELYWTDRKQGGRLYHIFNLGVYSHFIAGVKCSTLSLTLPFVSAKIAYIHK